MCYKFFIDFFNKYKPLCHFNAIFFFYSYRWFVHCIFTKLLLCHLQSNVAVVQLKYRKWYWVSSSC